jgi:hypothetical protein
MKRYIKFIPLLVAVLALTSCLKEKLAVGSEASNIVEFYTTEAINSPPTSLYPIYVKSFFTRPGQNFDVTVSYSGTDVAPQDITLQIGVDNDAVTKYNATGGTQYSVLPTASFALSSSTVVIKKGERRAVFNVTVKPEDFDDNLNQVIPLKITSSSFGTVSGNFGTVFYAVGARSKYDGLYTVSGTMVDQANATITGKYPQDYYLITQNSRAVGLYDFEYGGDYYHQITSGGATNVYGSFSPVFTFDDAGNITSVVNYYGQPAGNGRLARLDPTGVNKITAGTPGTAGFEFKVKYIMEQPVGTTRTVYNETFTFKGDRP